jgi:hypothetical protein
MTFRANLLVREVVRRVTVFVSCSDATIIAGSLVLVFSTEDIRDDWYQFCRFWKDGLPVPGECGLADAESLICELGLRV